MKYLAKYIAFVVAFVLATKLCESIELKVVDPTDADSVQNYADLVKADVCKEFDPSNPDHMAAVGDDVEKLKHLVELLYRRAEIVICAPKKEEDRFVFGGAGIIILVALGVGTVAGVV